MNSGDLIYDITDDSMDSAERLEKCWCGDTDSGLNVCDEKCMSGTLARCGLDTTLIALEH